MATIDEWLEMTGNHINEDEIDLLHFSSQLTKDELNLYKMEKDKHDGYFLPIQFENSSDDIDIIVYKYIKRNSPNAGKLLFNSKKVQILSKATCDSVG